MLIRLCLALFVVALMPVKVASAAVILQYHHVSETSPAVTSVSPAQFNEQMQYLAQQKFNVVPLAEVIAAIKQGKALPAKTVAITFDDGYRNIAENAAPILRKYGFPFTLFVAIEPIEKGFGEMMDWNQLQALADAGATIANHSWGHEHLIRRLPNENREQWLARIRDNLERTEAAIKQHTGQSVKTLAYPYGEYNTDLQQLLQQMGYIGVGQQSGAAGQYSDLTAIPRFPVAGAYANMETLKAKLNSLNMPVIAQTPTNPQLDLSDTQPVLSLKIVMDDIQKSQLTCFVHGQGKQLPIWVDADTFTIQAQKPLPAGRSRYNCTAPSKSQSGYYWFSQPWVRPLADGTWVQE
ncbi:polysaccharide deacetylase family protein [Shewanella avicenniae]|uniref:Polysaccharide deacetylase family protein n=1 Tax=Shewanella avicenniae TaxID=2814294 RepID=A0ABX7QS34_9GAMM|nr:polysaccharide deacetylase family protein [Shewanella avicenniae]QSX33735.1 polysaccharide deacetylase family protein [Shewanella avicenniae]